MQQAVREYADRGNAVIVGRGGRSFSRPRQECCASLCTRRGEWRVAHVIAAYRLDRKTAEAEVNAVESRIRPDYLHDWYGATFGDPENYDLLFRYVGAG